MSLSPISPIFDSNSNLSGSTLSLPAASPALEEEDPDIIVCISDTGYSQESYQQRNYSPNDDEDNSHIYIEIALDLDE